MVPVYRPIPLRLWLLTIGGIVVLGVAGFMLIEHYSFLDALYMVVITITTIGYYEVRPLSPMGKVFNIGLILTSFTLFTYSLARLTQFVASGEMAAYFKQRNLMKALDHLQQHVIICGFGRNGQQAARTLRAHKVPFVVIEKAAESLRDWLQDDPGLIYVQDDAVEDDVLQLAGIGRARALLVTLPEDADNVFIVLSARSLSPDLQIISRASSPNAAPKLYKAGANNVIMPDLIGGTHMATLVSKPDVLEFIDFLSGEDGEAIHIESVDYEKLPLAIRDRSLQEIMAWKKTGVNCIGIKDEWGRFVINPPDTTIITPGMKVIVLGTKEQILQMKENVG
ncbi:potassium channel protein [Flaviaesturariibacter flavus]|uniref:Potassium channel protein n=1 Tax=Flaviaesturariibacter flavus TaxID=2502780 RepID=A0A4R1BM95_9BACT|nr:potassium channel protein [Flaviaesturariibacter flavus]TCJ18620.1 potassium channel protein [Flaviaesturariibacter flavus]